MLVMAVSTSPEALGRMAQNIRSFIEMQNQLITSLKRDYDSVGAEWNDPKYREFGAKLTSTTTSIQRTEPELQELIAKLMELQRKLEDYLSTSV